MSKQDEIIDQLLKLLNKESLLEYLMLVGSWCLHIYRHTFKESDLLPPLRTTDIEFDASFLRRSPQKIDLLVLLRTIGFEVDFKGEGHIVMIRPEISIEFLVPEIGRGSSVPYPLPGFGINAQPLRFLSFLEEEIQTLPYKGLYVKVPHPARFALHKLLISQRRTKEYKAEKDVEQALAVWDMVARMGQAEKISELFHSLKPRWKAYIKSALQKSGELERITGAGF